MTPPSTTRWYVAQTQVNGETKASQNLIRRGFEIYLPRYLKRRRHARKVDVVAAPLFPRYVFINIDMATQRWRPIQSTVGVSHLVMNGDEPAAVPDGVLGVLRAREDDKGYVTIDRRIEFAPGDQVRILAGAFVDNLGLFEGVEERERVSILLDLLGRQVRIQLDADLVTAA